MQGAASAKPTSATPSASNADQARHARALRFLTAGSVDDGKSTLIGRLLYELVHVKWLERAHEVSFDGASVGISDYQVYRII